jgi:alkylated DNA repair dioxygenase AlkB
MLVYAIMVITRIELGKPNCYLELYTDLPLECTDALFDELWQQLPKQRRKFQNFGVVNPRYEQTYLRDQHYGGGLHRCQPTFTNGFYKALHEFVVDHFGVAVNGSNVNGYKDGRDWIGYHRDHETYQVRGAPVFSFSFGARRHILFKALDGSVKTVRVDMPSNSLLVMYGDTNEDFKHVVPKSTKVTGRRINVTFRVHCDIKQCNQPRGFYKTYNTRS